MLLVCWFLSTEGEGKGVEKGTFRARGSAKFCGSRLSVGFVVFVVVEMGWFGKVFAGGSENDLRRVSLAN